MLFPTKYPLLLVLFTTAIIFATITHAAPLSRSILKRGSTPENNSIKDTLNTLDTMYAELKKDNVADMGAKERQEAYAPLFEKINIAGGELEKQKKEDVGEEEKKKVDEWVKWQAEEQKKIDKEMDDKAGDIISLSARQKRRYVPI